MNKLGKSASSKCENAFELIWLLTRLPAFNGIEFIRPQWSSLAFHFVHSQPKVFPNYRSVREMKIPINKIARNFKLVPQCAAVATVPFVLYLIFICVVLSVSFPLKSSTAGNSLAEHRNGFTLIESNGLGEGEQKLLERANAMESYKNKSDILQHAFKMYG